MFDALDNHRQGGGQNGCDGVMSQKCQDLLEKEYTFPVNILQLIDSSKNGYQCPGLSLDKDEVDEACGEGFWGGISTSKCSISFAPPTYLPAHHISFGLANTSSSPHSKSHKHYLQRRSPGH
jgi:hypothetical protein